MAIKETKIYSIFRNKCPKCHEGNFFNYSNPYNLGNFFKMDDKCNVCGEKFTREPGFFFGAMFVSYALNVIWFVSAWVATLVLLPADINLFLLASIIVGFGLIMAPLTYRLSRLIWINFFISYEPFNADLKKAEVNNFKTEINN
jgi:uncharacterized protein (DUF983 family)